MFRSNSLLGNDTSSYAGSIESNGFSATDEVSSQVSSQVSSMSRPSAKSIYMQRRDYAVSVNKMMDKLQYRVEHLFTCDLDEKELRSVADCVERLKVVDGMGHVWGQNMRLEVRGANLLLTDIETKEELESMAFGDVLELKAVLDAGAFNSLLTVSVRPGGKHTTTVFMFQCEDVRADYVQKDLSAALSRRRDDSGISSNAGPIARHQGMENLHIAAQSSEPEEQKPAVDPEPRWMAPDYEEDDVPEPELVVPQEEEEKKEEEKKEEEKKEEEEEEAPSPREEVPSPQPSTTEEEPLSPPRRYTELDRNIDILNHILSDIEIFMGKVAAVVAKNAKKKKKKKKGKAMDGMPPVAEFEMCLHNIKCGFNLVGELDGQINNPDAPEFVHSLFSTLAFVVSHCPEDLPKIIVAPLLTPQCIRLLSGEANAEEDQLWQSLGDAWNIPSTKWPDEDEDIPTYDLQFFDGWQPPEVTAAPEPSEPMRRQEERQQPAPSEPMKRQEERQQPAPSEPMKRQEEHPKPAPSEPMKRQEERQQPAPSEPLRRQEERQQPAPSQAAAKWTPPAKTPRKTRPGESKPRHMQVTCDFISRNHRELSVTKGEIVELLDVSKLWWKVRNSRGDEGFVPNNVLEADDQQPVEQNGGAPVLTKKSKPAEVKAWLEDKSFSKITVRCLGGLSGAMLLGMTREELKTVCLEEGGRVFSQLQAVKSAMAVAI